MSKIQLSDVVDKLFEQFDKINDEKLSGDQLKEQLERTKSVVHIAKQITETARLGLDAQLGRDNMSENTELPTMLKLGQQK